MEYLYILITIVVLFVLCSFVTYRIVRNKFSKLFLLDKRQQAYIKQIVNYNTRFAVLQRLFFCVILTICSKTHNYGIKQLHKHFNIPQSIDNNEKLINYFVEIYNNKSISFKLENGKYTISSDIK